MWLPPNDDATLLRLNGGKRWTRPSQLWEKRPAGTESWNAVVANAPTVATSGPIGVSIAIIRVIGYRPGIVIKWWRRCMFHPTTSCCCHVWHRRSTWPAVIQDWWVWVHSRNLLWVVHQGRVCPWETGPVRSQIRLVLWVEIVGRRLRIQLRYLR